VTITKDMATCESHSKSYAVKHFTH